MASWSSITSSTLNDMIDKLNNVLVGTNNLHNGVDVDGLTFIVNPGTERTVTFTAKGRNWTLEEVIDQINAAHGDLTGSASAKVIKTSAQGPGSRYLAMWLEGGLTVDKDGTANEALGFNASADQVQAVPIANTVVQKLSKEEFYWIAITYQ